MNKEILKNPSFSMIPDVKNICDDYFGALNLKLNYFGHINVLPDGKFHFLASEREWPEYGFAEEMISPGGFTIYDSLENSIRLPHVDSATDIGWTDEVMKTSKERFGIENLMIIFQKYEDHYQGYFFDLHDKRACEKYINHFNLFENFIFYYKDKARDLLKIASKNQLQVHEKYLLEKSLNSKMDNCKPVSNNDEIIFDPSLHALLPKQYFLMHARKSFPISAREYQCLALLSYGKKIKDLANILNISPRTIDTHLINLKRKLHVKTLSKAVEIYWRNRIHQL